MTETQQQNLPSDQHCGFIALVGASNVGKSTLMNRFVGEKVSIVSPKVQTTRTRIRGICVKDNTQLIFIDTPGVFSGKGRLEKAMVDVAKNALGEADIVLFILDANKGLDADSEKFIKELEKTHRKAVLVLNKIDLVEKTKLLPLIEKTSRYSVFSDTFMISAEKGEQTDELLNYLIQKMPKMPFMFPADEISDLPNRLFAAELTREKLFLYLQQELPYSVTVETNTFQDKGEKGLVIEQTILTERDSQKAIIVGHKGQMVKKIGMSAKQELSHLFHRPVHLYLFVKVKENWRESASFYKEWGLE